MFAAVLFFVSFRFVSATLSISLYYRGRQVVNKAIDCASRKIGLYWIDDAKGKESITEFERVSYNGKTSVVKCKQTKKCGLVYS